ncbi:MAG: hypothetical protein ACC656_09870, partial [Candidatus Heimdallarchaeota archaeon]
MGNEKINSLLQEMLKLSQVTNYSDFVIFNPKLIYNKHRLFLKNPTDRLYEGSFHGLLFENYATNILLKAVDKLESIEWIVHILQPQKKMKAKEIKELNCLAYDNEGSIILFRDGYNHAEFDGILSIN